MIEEFAKLLVQILKLVGNVKLRKDTPVQHLYRLYSDLTTVIEQSAMFLDALERFAVAQQDEGLLEGVYDRLVVLGEDVEKLADELGLSCKIQKDGYMLVYGGKEKVKIFVKKMADKCRETRKN